MRFRFLIFMLCAIGCSNAPTPTPTQPISPVAAKPVTPSGKQWSDLVIDDAILRSFIKTWHMQMNSDTSLTVEAKYQPWLPTYDGREFIDFTFTMQQGDNAKKWVVFDCDAVAEKIVQSNLVPIAQQDCQLLREEAIHYWKDHPDPDEFTDSAGHVWKRQ